MPDLARSVVGTEWSSDEPPVPINGWLPVARLAGVTISAHVAGAISLRADSATIKFPRSRAVELIPLPAVIALLSWVFLFVTSARTYIALGLVTPGVGVAVYFCAWLIGIWPFGRRSLLQQ